MSLTRTSAFAILLAVLAIVAGAYQIEICFSADTKDQPGQHNSTGDSKRIVSRGDLSAASERPAQSTYVGREVCRQCHAENFALHSRHGHASTFHHTFDTDLPSKFDAQEFDAGQSHGVYEYDVDKTNRLSVRLPAQFNDQAFPLQYVLGSGQHAQTMLTLTTGTDGNTEAIEHRVSWFSNTQLENPATAAAKGQLNGASANIGRLGITPGHAGKNPHSPLELFGDTASGKPLQRCVYCHTTSGKVDGERIADLVENVNCEKCHGPGSLHVEQAKASPSPSPYSVGSQHWDTESEIQLCGDCHRLPKDISVEELRDYPDLLSRFQPVGMLRSACYLQSAGELRCTTCHNPHQSIKEVNRLQHVQQCVACHQPGHQDDVVCPVSATEGCIECHMPKIRLDSGLDFHDHWIRTFRESVETQ